MWLIEGQLLGSHWSEKVYSPNIYWYKADASFYSTSGQRLCTIHQYSSTDGPSMMHEPRVLKVACSILLGWKMSENEVPLFIQSKRNSFEDICWQPNNKRSPNLAIPTQEQKYRRQISNHSLLVFVHYYYYYGPWMGLGGVTNNR